MMIILMTAFLVVLASAAARPGPVRASSPPTAAQLDTSLDAAISSDDTQSVTLPSGEVLWVFGDVDSVNGVSTVSSYGYPHDAFAGQPAGTTTFTPLAGTYGYGWQQVPNWSDGSYFWFATPIVSGNELYIIGSRVEGGADFTVEGQYMAEFNATTLAYQGIMALPGGSTGTTTWGGVAQVPGGWWITGSHNVTCTDATDCKAGDMAYVPNGDLATASDWEVTNNVIPATANIGTTLAMVAAPGGWDIFTKEGDAYGSNSVERLSASSPLGTWTVNDTWAAAVGSGDVSYGVAVHPEQPAPAGQELVSYDTNGTTCEPQFMYLPL